jgi:arabinoxylan arabinofuranohydrolase
MHKKLFMTAAVMAACIQTNAQTLATEFKASSNNNPISPTVYCADPTALDYNGRLYVYGSNDHQQFIKNGKKGENGYGDIKSLVVFSTDDMVNWTFHGTIDVAKLCSTWSTSKWWRAFHNSWAPSVMWRTTDDGKDEFFLYFANNSHGVGVLKASSPIGPWTSPLRESLIGSDTPGAVTQGANFDPGVVIDDNGTGWITFGGLPPEGANPLMPNTARIAKLKPSMTALDGSAIVLPAPYHFEASELNVINGKYVYTYCSNWSNRSDADWNTYKSQHGINVPKPETCTMCYMVTDNPTDPNSWVYKGVYGPHPGSSPNNHSHLHKFQGKYYHIYHNGLLLEGMKKAKATESNASTYRSICVDEVAVDETTQTVSKASLTAKGVSGIKYLNPYDLQQAETMGNCGGVNYEDFTNITKNTSISTLGNDASRNLQVKMKAGAWINQKRVDFGATGADKFTLRAKGTGTLEIRLGAKSLKTVATVNFASTDMEEQTIEVDPTQFKGTKSVFFVVTSADNFYVDAWQFTEVGSTGIQNIRHQTSDVRHQTYDLSGRRLSGAQQHHGIIIKNGKKIWH